MADYEWVDELKIYLVAQGYNRGEVSRQIRRPNEWNKEKLLIPKTKNNKEQLRRSLL